jgi:hypothetical protein
MPERKFYKVEVLLTEKEYEELRSAATLTGPGLVGAAIRQRLGWQQSPYGWGAAYKRYRADLYNAAKGEGE